VREERHSDHLCRYAYASKRLSSRPPLPHKSHSINAAGKLAGRIDSFSGRIIGHLRGERKQADLASPGGLD